MAAWSASQLRTFLDHVRDDRWHPVWLLASTTGARRGELLGARWSDLDPDAGRWTVSQARTIAGHRESVGAPKTTAGVRTVALDPTTAATLRGWRRRQLAERLAIGPAWPDVDLAFLEADGTAPKPETISRRFARLVTDTELPRIRLHDLRHTHATIALCSGVPPHVVSRRLGHANITVTLGLYAHLLPGADEQAAATVAGAILGNSVTNP